MEGWAYPYPVQYLQFDSEGRPVRMSYMDVQPATSPHGMTVVLFHGKNFGADYWENTLRALAAMLASPSRCSRTDRSAAS